MHTQQYIPETNPGWDDNQQLSRLLPKSMAASNKNLTQTQKFSFLYFPLAKNTDTLCCGIMTAAKYTVNVYRNTVCMHVWRKNSPPTTPWNSHPLTQGGKLARMLLYDIYIYIQIGLAAKHTPICRLRLFLRNYFFPFCKNLAFTWKHRKTLSPETRTKSINANTCRNICLFKTHHIRFWQKCCTQQRARNIKNGTERPLNWISSRNGTHTPCGVVYTQD